MSFSSRGLPSRGCNKCRQRKIKCDEVRPACSRCVKLGNTDCQYRDTFERTWRDQTQETAEKVRCAKAAHSKASPINSDTTDDSTDTRATADTPPDLGPLSISTDKLSGPILQRFYFDWVVQRQDTPNGGAFQWMDALPGMYSAAAPSSTLALTVDALAHATYGQRFHDRHCVAEAVRRCGMALRSLNETIVRLGGDAEPPPSIDEVVVCVLLLGVYETVVDGEVSVRGSWTAHMAGAAALLDGHLRRHVLSSSLSLRGSIAASDSLNNSAMIMFRQSIHNSLQKGHTPTLPLEARDAFCPRDSALVYTQLGHHYEAASLCHRWRTLLSSIPNNATDDNTGPSPALDSLLSIMADAASLDARIVEWTHSLPQHAAYTTVKLDAANPEHPHWLRELLLGAEGQPLPSWTPSAVHAYPSIFILMTWRSTWTVRLVLSHALLHSARLIQHLSPCHNQPTISIPRIRDTITSCIDHLCESSLASLTDTNSPPNSASSTAGSLRWGAVEDIRSLQGYLLMQSVHIMYFTLRQVEAAEEWINVQGRRAWVEGLRRFMGERLGIAKARAEVAPERFGRIPVQLWGMGA